MIKTTYIYIYLFIPSKFKVSDIVRTIKSISCKLLKKKFEYMQEAYWGRYGIWSDGYFVSTTMPRGLPRVESLLNFKCLFEF